MPSLADNVAEILSATTDLQIQAMLEMAKPFDPIGWLQSDPSYGFQEEKISQK